MRILSWNEPDLRRHVHLDESARSMCSKHQDKTKKLVFVWWLPKRLFFLPVTCFYRLLFQKRCLGVFLTMKAKVNTEQRTNIRDSVPDGEQAAKWDVQLPTFEFF